MTFGCRIDEARLSVLLDIRHPLAYLALQPALRFGRELGIEINWLPLSAPPLKLPSTPGADADRGLRHRSSRARAIAREIETYAGVQGLVVREYYRAGESGAISQGWLFVRERHPDRLEAFLSEAFRAYWAVELDPSRDGEVAALIDSVGADGSGYRSWSADEGEDVAAAVAEELRERGLWGVPCYLAEGEVFLGRQHLPMIRWILAGRSGRGPI